MNFCSKEYSVVTYATLKWKMGSQMSQEELEYHKYMKNTVPKHVSRNQVAKQNVQAQNSQIIQKVLKQEIKESKEESEDGGEEGHTNKSLKMDSVAFTKDEIDFLLSLIYKCIKEGPVDDMSAAAQIEDKLNKMRILKIDAPKVAVETEIQELQNKTTKPQVSSDSISVKTINFRELLETTRDKFNHSAQHNSPEEHAKVVNIVRKMQDSAEQRRKLQEKS